MGLFSFISDLLSSIWNIIKNFWPLLLIAAVIFFPEILSFVSTAWSWVSGTVWPAITAFAAKYGWLTTLAIGFGAISAIDPSLATKIATNVGQGLGAAATAAGGVLSATTGALLSNPLVWVAGGLFVVMLLARRTKNRQSGVPQ